MLFKHFKFGYILIIIVPYFIQAVFIVFYKVCCVCSNNQLLCLLISVCVCVCVCPASILSQLIIALLACYKICIMLLKPNDSWRLLFLNEVMKNLTNVLDFSIILAINMHRFTVFTVSDTSAIVECIYHILQYSIVS